MSATALDLWAELMAHAVVKASLLMLVAFAVIAAGSRLSAGLRHLILVCALGASLALPLVWVLAPGWGPARGRVAARAAVAALAPAEHVAEMSEAKVERAAPAVGDLAAIDASPRSRPDLFALWSGGALLLGLRGLRARRLRHRLEMEARPVAEAALGDTLRTCMAELGLRRRVEVLVAPGVAGPMTWGFVHPRILLPAGAERWSPARRRVVLLHELAHVCRGDGLSRLVAEIAVALMWFHPLVWLCAMWAAEEAERACDDLVLSQGVRPSRYLEELVGLVREMRGRVGAQPALGFARRRGLGRRAAAIAAAGRSRRAPSAAEVGVALTLALLGAMPLAGLGKARRTAGAATAEEVAAEQRSSTVSAPDVERDFRALTRDADRGALLERLVLDHPESLAVVLSLAPEVAADAVLEPLLQRVLAGGLAPALLEPFLAATWSLEADAARQAVLVDLVSSHELPEPALLAAIRAAAAMRAVAARTDALVAIARSQALTPAAAEEIRRFAVDLDRFSARREVLGAIFER